jgi:plastocyanin
MKKLFYLTASTLALSGLAAMAGDLTGTVTLKGTPPAENSFADAMQADPNCTALYSGNFPTTHFYAVGAGGSLADVVVTIEGGDFKSTGASAAPVMLDQKGCIYVPAILAVQTGQKIMVKNSDPCVHNIHTVPTANEMKNLLQSVGAPDLEFVFDKPEPFLKFQCDVHPWMHAWVTVVDNPYFALSGKDGKFTIKNIPNGHYKVKFAHRKLGTQSFDIDIKDGAASQDCAFEIK